MISALLRKTVALWFSPGNVTNGSSVEIFCVTHLHQYMWELSFRHLAAFVCMLEATFSGCRLLDIWELYGCPCTNATSTSTVCTRGLLDLLLRRWYTFASYTAAVARTLQCACFKYICSLQACLCRFVATLTLLWYWDLALVHCLMPGSCLGGLLWCWVLAWITFAGL